jgi:hypothetical protein
MVLYRRRSCSIGSTRSARCSWRVRCWRDRWACARSILPIGPSGQTTSPHSTQRIRRSLVAGTIIRVPYAPRQTGAIFETVLMAVVVVVVAAVVVVVVVVQEWVWVYGMFLQAQLTMEATNAHGVHGQLLRHRAHLLRTSPWSSLPELTNGNGRPCADSCPAQAWSLATVLDVLHRLYLLQQKQLTSPTAAANTH